MKKTFRSPLKKKVVIESKFEQIKLSQVLEVLESGNRPKGGVGEYLEGIPSLGGEHIGLDGRISINKNNLKFVPIDFFNSSKQGILKDLDILICKDGALTGKVALFRTNDLGYESSMINEHVFLLRANENSIQGYLFNLLLSKKGQELLKVNITGQAQGGLNRGNLLDIKIPLPPLDIQQKIVSEIEALEKQEEKAVEEVEKLRQSIGNTINNSKAPLTKLEDITTKIGSGATPKGGEGSYQSSGISLIRSQNIYDYGMIVKGLAFISEEQARKLDNVTVEKNDILFNITGASIARCCIVEDKYLPARVNQHVSIIRTNEKALPKYVHAILISTEFKEKLLEIGNGATSRQAITKLQLEDFKIPLPTIEEQKKIVAKIEKIETKIAELKKQIADIPKQKEEILKKYLN